MKSPVPEPTETEPAEVQTEASKPGGVEKKAFGLQSLVG